LYTLGENLTQLSGISIHCSGADQIDVVLYPVCAHILFNPARLYQIFQDTSKAAYIAGLEALFSQRVVVLHKAIVKMSRHSKPRMVDSADPTPFDFQSEVYQRGLKHEKPPLTFDSTQWATLAREKLDDDAWGYVHGSAGARETDDNNLAAFRKFALIPNRLVPANFPDLSVRLFGKEYAYPIAIAPVGVQKIFHKDGELAVAAAGFAEHVPYIMSTAASTSIENAAKANGSGHRWYQLYWPSNEHDSVTASMLHRAQASGFDVLVGDLHVLPLHKPQLVKPFNDYGGHTHILITTTQVVTLDTYILGWRPSDLDNGYNPFLRADNIGVEIGFSDPEYRKLFREKYGKEVEDDVGTAAGTWAKIIFPGYSVCSFQSCACVMRGLRHLICSSQDAGFRKTCLQASSSMAGKI